MTNILLIGCGKMGGALYRGWQQSPANHTLVIVDPTPPATPQAATFCQTLEAVDPAFHPAIVVIAVKPQSMASVLPPYARYKDALFLSIAAGQSLDRLATLLGGADRPLVRAMPNLPASIGAGVSVAVANSFVTPAQQETVTALLEAVGSVAWVTQETQIDAVTALSGSGPAYVFALVEAMAVAGETLGLDPALAAHLARATVIGSGALLAQAPETATDLRKAVTSPGGTTEAALKYLLSDQGIFPLMQQALAAAAHRAAELAT